MSTLDLDEFLDEKVCKGINIATSIYVFIGSIYVSFCLKGRFHKPAKPANETTLIGRLEANAKKFSRSH